jgi:hypothetical protein
MPAYAVYLDRVISIIAGRFEATAALNLCKHEVCDVATGGANQYSYS